MKFTLQYQNTIPTLEEANPEERKRIERGMSAMEEIAVYEMLNSFVLCGDTERPLHNTEASIKNGTIVNPDSARDEFMASALVPFFKGRCATFKVVGKSGEILNLARVEPYLISQSIQGEHNPEFLKDSNIVLLVSAPTDSYVSEFRRFGGNKLEVSVSFIRPYAIKSIWCRRGEIKDYYACHPVPLKNN